MRIVVDSDYVAEYTIWSVLLEDNVQKYRLVCHNKQSALALRAALAGTIEVHTIEEIEE